MEEKNILANVFAKEHFAFGSMCKNWSQPCALLQFDQLVSMSRHSDWRLTDLGRLGRPLCGF